MNNRIKILECIRQGQIGGGESHLLSLVENLDKSRFDPVVLSFTDGPMMTELGKMNISNHVIPTEKPFDILKWKAIKEFIKEQNVDIIHAHGTRANSNVLWASRSLGLPVIYTVHGWSFHPDQSPLVRKIRIWGEKYLTSKTDINISVSASNQKSGKDHIQSFKSVVINNGIDQNKFNPTGSYKNIREELGIPGNKILVLFIARFTSHKQPLSLIQAFANAFARNENLHLLMVGDGDQKTEALSMVESLSMKDHISLETFRKDVPDILASADIFVLPSLWEGLPIGLLEALAMGKAVIATKVDGTSEIIRNEENGILIEIHDLVKNLTEALVDLASDESKRKRFSEKAVETVRMKFNAAEMTRKIENVYSSLVKK